MPNALRRAAPAGHHVFFLLTYGRTDTVLSDVEASGFELVGGFRDGFLQGGTACDLGI